MMGWLRHQHYYTFITPEDKTMSSDAHRIAMFGDLEAMRKLVEEEKIVDEADDRGFTPLNWAVRNGHMEVLQLLIDNGCSLEKPSFGGMRPLHHACNKNLEKIYQTLHINF